MPVVVDADAYDTTQMQAPAGAVWRQADGTYASGFAAPPAWVYPVTTTSPTVDAAPPTLSGSIAAFGS